jgi:hypothetical protein
MKIYKFFVKIDPHFSRAILGFDGEKLIFKKKIKNGKKMAKIKSNITPIILEK